MQRQDKVTRLMSEFASGITSVTSKLVQGWTELEVNEELDTGISVERDSSVIGVGPLYDVGGAANTMCPNAQAIDGCAASMLQKSPIRRLKNVVVSRMFVVTRILQLHIL
jgi:hypothetical protein